MAKINGVEVKNLKGFMGREGYCYQGDVWLNGKKLGFWSQDSWGGPDDFSFDESLLDKACSDYKEGFPDGYQYKEYCDSKDVFMHAVVEMKCIEKDCKKEYKNGWGAVFYMTDGFHCTWLGIPAEDAKNVRGKYPNQVKQMESQMFKNGHTEHIFLPGSFDIIVDKNNPVPAFFVK